MKLRMSRSEIDFYVKSQIAKGFSIVEYKKERIVLKKGESFTIITYKSNGWVEVS